MSELFADSFYFLATINPRDPCHRHATDYLLPGRLVTTRAVLLEVMDALSDPRQRPAAVAFWLDVRDDSEVDVVPLDDELWLKGAALYQARPDKAWSLTDCLSFVVMQDRGIAEALTADHHFEQAGFRALLRAM